MAQLRTHFLIPDEPFASYAAYLEATGESAVLVARGIGPEEVVEELHRSGLRGRGGAGFRTSVKWTSVRGHPCPTRYVVGNAAEGEPGTFKDRYLLRKNPYATLEGMIIAAEAVGAKEMYLAIKGSYAKEIARVRAAIAEMSAAGITGDREIHVVEGPEEYLYGEEKALLEVVEGNDPLPREPHYPPYERGLFATPGSPNPALVNNAQTFAHVASIVRSGGEGFADLGTRDTPGPLLFTVSGAVQRPGVYELPAGIPLRRLFEEVAGGPRPGRTLKAAICGVSASIILRDRFDTLADFASLGLIGSSLGSAGFIVFDDETSMPRVAQTLARFLYVESCNQCSACKHGLRIASTALDQLFDPAHATADDTERALYGARSAPQGNRCYLPVQGSVVLPALLSRFHAEFEAQIAHPDRATEPYVLPKIVDFDEATRTFTYDPDQARKLPNWTYEDLPPASLRGLKPPSPGRPQKVPATVRLAPDVRDALARHSAVANRDVEHLANEVLRTWLKDAAEKR